MGGYAVEDDEEDHDTFLQTSPEEEQAYLESEDSKGSEIETEDSDGLSDTSNNDSGSESGLGNSCFLAYVACEWTDRATGTVLAYAPCVEEIEKEEEEAIELDVASPEEPLHVLEPRWGFERHDEGTGAMLAYEVCDDCVKEEATQLGLICPDEQEELQSEHTIPLEGTVEWKDPCTGVMLGYLLCDGEDDNADEDDEAHEDVAELEGSEEAIVF